MSYEIFWVDDEKTIVHQRFLDGFNVDDLYKITTESAKMLSTVDHPVDIIVEIAGRVNMRGMLSAAMYVNRIVPPNQRFVLGVNVSRVARRMIEAIRKVAPKALERVHFVDTLDEAMAFLATRRAYYEALSD